MEYFTDAFKKYADFSGRATRTQYWMFILIYMIIYIVLAVIDAFVLGMPALSGVLSLVAIIPSLSIAARRLHDTGRSGWWLLISLLPLIGIIVLLVFLVMDSDGDNNYGANPKAA
ncbi:MAG: DUF805 domain-containing protein [Proteobacteria bacterium]|nr:DUF805 domain-containing protein [Pseudomonadota bacterium]NOG61661.1 DUF805 domain-containing protein [Pseudomonadota bacterium]